MPETFDGFLKLVIYLLIGGSVFLACSHISMPDQTPSSTPNENGVRL